MLNRIFDLGQAAVESSGRAVRLLLDVAMMASDYLRHKVGVGSDGQEGWETRPIPPPAPRTPPASTKEPVEPSSPSARPASEARSASETKPRSAEDAPAPAPKKVKPKPSKGASPKKKAGGAAKSATASKAKSRKKTGGGAKRPDQMIRVLELISAGDKPWMSAKEISDAGEAAGKPILPGNVRKVVRARGKDLIETRPRKGSRRGAMEYRMTSAGRKKLKG